jgi:hypothetical protein
MNDLEINSQEDFIFFVSTNYQKRKIYSSSNNKICNEKSYEPESQKGNKNQYNTINLMIKYI